MKNALPVIPGRRAALATLSREERDFARQWGDVPAMELKTAKARFSFPRINIERAALAVLLAIACGSGAALAVMQSAPAPVVQLVADTADGNRYIAGEGDTCADAARNAQFPAGPLVFIGCVIEGAR